MHTTIEKLVEKNRSYRRFYNNHVVDRGTLEHLVNLARMSPSGRNLQPLKYYLSRDEDTNAKIYQTLAWAGYLSGWNGPEEDERPSAYIVMMVDRELTAGTPAIDQGIACQSILLGAVEQGLGGCVVASVKKAELAHALNIAHEFEIALVIALGKPKEEVKLVPVDHDGSIKYYRDDKGIHYVPKRDLRDIIIG